jgi:hypothetical protein
MEAIGPTAVEAASASTASKIAPGLPWRGNPDAFWK